VPLSRNLGTITSWNPLGHSSPVTGLLYLYLYLTMEALEGLGVCKIGEQVFTLKYADDLELLAKEEMVLQGIIDRTIEIGRYFCYCWC